MNLITKTLLLGVACLFSLSNTFSANITILESQSIHPLHKMDNNWQNAATTLGHSATIVTQSFLDDATNLENTDVLIISSGLIDLPQNRRANIIAFVANGGNLYLQSEYLLDLPGNETFINIVNNFGGNFSWEGEAIGGLSPMNIIGEFANENNNEIDYFWYGTHGSGSENIQPILQHDNKYWGFIYCPMVLTAGKVITTSDQDWIRTLDNTELMENMLEYLTSYQALSVLPTVSIESSTVSPCDGDLTTMTFTATVNNNLTGTTLQWMVNGQVVENQTAMTYTTDLLEEGDVVECHLLFNAECAAHQTLSNPILIAPIVPTEAPVISIMTNTNTICEGSDLTFTANLTSGDAFNFGFQWLINNNEVTEATGASFSSSSLNNNDEVSLVLTYDDNCDNDLELVTETIAITVTPVLNPNITIIADQNEICAGELVTFTTNTNDLGDNPSFQWQIDGQNVGDNAPFFTTNNLSEGQNINCILTIEQNNCSTTNEAFSNTLSISVYTMTTPTVEILATSTDICQGESVSFTANGNDFGSNPSFQWVINGQNVGSNAPTFTTNQLSDGQQVSCILTADVACADQSVVSAAPIAINVSTGGVPSLIIEATNRELCFGETVTFTAEGNNHGSNAMYQWMVDGQPRGTNSKTYTDAYLHNGQTITCVLTNDEACPTFINTTSNDITVTVTEIAIEVLELSYEHCGNNDGFIEIEAMGGVAPYTYEWMNGEKAAFIDGLSRGKVSVIVTDANGCTGEGQIEMLNLEAPEIAELNITDATCNGDRGHVAVSLVDTDVAYTYEWIDATGNIIARASNLTNIPVGIYELNISNEYGCAMTQEVVIGQTSSLEVFINETKTIELGQSIQLEAITNSNEAVSFSWEAVETLSCMDCANPTATPLQNALYRVTATNEYGCTATAEVIINVEKNQDLFIPNAFTPNGDGSNDYFTVFAGSNVNQIKALRVFDRWGAEMFSRTNFQPNVEVDGWDGTFKGKTMDQGVFVFMVEVEYVDGSTKVHSGDISVMAK